MCPSCVSEIEFREGGGTLAALVEGGKHDWESPWPADLIAHVATRTPAIGTIEEDIESLWFVCLGALCKELFHYR